MSSLSHRIVAYDGVLQKDSSKRQSLDDQGFFLGPLVVCPRRVYVVRGTRGRS
jgi:hypothetical protein